MPRQKKQAVEETVAPEVAHEEVAAPVVEAALLPFYAGMPATITKTHEDGHIDLTVSYDGVNQVPKLRVSPESVEYKKAP